MLRQTFVRAIPGLLLAAALARGDGFDLLEGPRLARLAGSDLMEPCESLSMPEIGGLPRVLTGARSGLVLVKTGEGNLAVVEITLALRKPKAAGAEPLAVALLERTASFEAPSCLRRLAAGRNVALFEGFEFDLDTAQVVPAGQGGDLAFRATGEAGLSLLPVGGATLWKATRPLGEAPAPGEPSPGRAVIPGDFAGVYNLDANGQWTGRLELAVDERKEVTGRFRSDQTGQSYKITGQAAFEAPNRIRFAFDLPRTRLEFDGRIWTVGKGAIAGTVNLLGRDYGFQATRQRPDAVQDSQEARP